MKKNTMMRLAAVMLMCVLLTTSVVGGTFAKYVTSDSDTDIARVAKWGVNVEVVVDGAFATEYNAKSAVNDHDGNAIVHTVVSADNNKNVLAPGTHGVLLKTATISGSPEVAVNVTKEATLTLTGWEVDGAYYCPLVITINGTNKYYGMDNAYLAEPDPAAAFIAAVEGALDADYNLPANSDLDESYYVTWEWLFEGGIGQTDEKDTALGNKAADPAEDDITIQFEYKITVTQPISWLELFCARLWEMHWRNTFNHPARQTL